MARESTQGKRTEPTYRKAIAVGALGNVLEWYDFGVYGYLAPTLSQLFFPKGDPTASLLSSFAVFGVGFVMRPVGSLLFGAYADGRGRRAALSAVSFLMAISTTALGLLPTYEKAGVWAPVLLLLVRLLQGIAVGGESGGSTAYLVEFAPPGRRGFFGSWQLVGVATGFLLGEVTAALLSGSMSQTDRLAWGWRLPFLCGVCVGAVGAYMRWHLQDTPKFADAATEGQTSATPLSEAVSRHPRALARIFGTALYSTVAYYTVLVYLTAHLTSVGNIPAEKALWMGTSCLGVFILVLPAMGALSDRFGRRPLLLTSCAAHVALGYPLFVMSSSGRVRLAMLSQLVLVLAYAPFAGTCSAFYAELLPTRVRATGIAIAGNLAIAVFGGFAPFIAIYLVRETGISEAPAAYLILAAIVGGATVMRTRETAFLPLG